MENDRALLAMAVFLVGAVAGGGLSFLLLWLTNVFYHLVNRPPIGITWLEALPLGILVGLGIAFRVLDGRDEGTGASESCPELRCEERRF